MKHSRAHVHFFVSVLGWLVILQAAVFWYVSRPGLFICNSSGAWPFSDIPFLGHGILTLFVTLVVAGWAWKTLRAPQESIGTIAPAPILWGAIVATGISHSVERLSSECILDYWQLALGNTSIHINLGDVSLTLCFVALALIWLRTHKKVQ